MKQYTDPVYRAWVFGLVGAALVVFALYVRVYPLSLLEGDVAWVGKSMQVAASAVGMSAGVLPNQYNTLALELQVKDAKLTAKEKELAAKELALQKDAELRAAGHNWLVILVGAGLFFLIALNYYLDYRRRRQMP